MGQQQLLLVVLGLIVVSVAIGIANELFDAHAEESNKDSIANELINLGTLAQQFFNKPAEMGGGNQSFINWNIPAELDSTASGIYKIATFGNSSLTITGTPHPHSGYNWQVQSTITKMGIETKVIQ